MPTFLEERINLYSYTWRYEDMSVFLPQQSDALR